MKKTLLRRWALAACAVALYIYGFGTCGTPHLQSLASAAVEDVYVGTISLTLSPTGTASKQKTSGDSPFYVAGQGTAVRIAPTDSTGAARGQTIDISRLEGVFSLQLTEPDPETGITISATGTKALGANLAGVSWFVYYKLSDIDETWAWTGASKYYVFSGQAHSSGTTPRVIHVFPRGGRYMQLGFEAAATPFTKAPYTLTVR